MRNPERVGLPLACLTCLAGAAVTVASWSDWHSIDEELNTRANSALPASYSPEDLDQYRRLVSQYESALQTGLNDLVAEMRSTGMIGQARGVVEDEQIRQTQISILKQEIFQEDSGLLGISKGLRELGGRLGTALGVALVGGVVAGFFAARSQLRKDNLDNSVPGLVIEKPTT